jgi:hypothetical protein
MEATDGSGSESITLRDNLDNSIVRGIYWTSPASSGGYMSVTPLLRDPAGWFHFILTRDGTTVVAYINGVSVPTLIHSAFSSGGTFNTQVEHRIGLKTANNTALDGYLAEVNFIDGQALTPSDFGEFGDYGEWKPKAYDASVSGAYGTNGFYLDFKNTSTKYTITANGNTNHSTSQNKIGSSSMYFDGTGDYLTTSASDISFGNNPFTVEFWFYPTSSTSTLQFLFTQFNNTASGRGGLAIGITSGYKIWILLGNGTSWVTESSDSGTWALNTWHHIAVVRSTASGNIKTYLDGTEVYDHSSVNLVADINYEVTIGRGGRTADTYDFNGYIDELRISNTARYTTTFTPPTTAFTEDSNTLLLIHSDEGNGTTIFTDDSGIAGGLANDASSNSNDWASSGIASTDQMIDTPTNNFCTINPLAIASSVTLSEGNSRVVTGAYTNPILGSFLIPESGKWYWEVYVSSVGEMMTGIIDAGVATSTMYANKTGYYRSGGASNGYYIEGTVVSTAPASYTDGDIIRIAYNADDNQITWYKGTSSQGTENLTATKKPVIPYSVHGSSSGSSTFVANFGQDSSFAGTPTASLPTRPTGSPFNDGTYGEFFYEPPSGFLALCTANLPVPDVIPSEHFNTDVWAGDGGSSVSSTEVGFQPDFIWAKQRNISQSHTLIDSVRGAGYIQGSDASGSDYTATTYGQVTSFDENGFTATKGSNSSYSYFNHNGGTYVAWNWKAATNANTFNVLSGGSITSSSSNTTAGVTAGTLTTGWGVSANRDAGFSIVKYTGSGVDNSTIGHGLNSAPEMIIIKKRSQGDGWNTYHKDLTSGHEIFLNTTAASISDNSQASWGDTHPSSVGASTYAIGYAGDTNADTETFIAYCFHSVDGYSKVGSYTGNGVADGPFVYTGFRPAYVMTKSTSTGYWITHDTSRAPSNSSDKELFPNDSLGEYDGNRYLDVLSNGFKLRHSDSTQNTTGQTYIYIAFAETPFKYANAR